MATNLHVYQFFPIKIGVTQVIIIIFPKFKKFMDVDTFLCRLSSLLIIPLKGAGGGGGGLHQNSLEIDFIVVSGRRE